MTKKTPPVKYKKAPQAPRRFKSSYMFFSIEKHKKIREELAAKGENAKPSTTEVAKMVSAAWKALSHDEREKFEDMARRDKARYEVEKTMYAGPWKVPAKKRSQKDPNAPKRPMSAFLSFSNSKRPQVKAENQDLGNAEISRILAQMWKDASEEERKEHIDKEFELRREYKTAIAEWRKESECELEATRKEREEEAMRTAMIGKDHHGVGDHQDTSNDTSSWNASYQYYNHDYGYHHQHNQHSMSPVPYGYQSAMPPPGGTSANANHHPYGYPPPPQSYYATRPQSYGSIEHTSDAWTTSQTGSHGPPPPQPSSYYYQNGQMPYSSEHAYPSQYPPSTDAPTPPTSRSYPDNDTAGNDGYDQGYGASSSQYYPQHHDPYGQSYYSSGYPYSSAPNDEGHNDDGADANYSPPSPAPYPYHPK